jgi:hypothetical protein
VEAGGSRRKAGPQLAAWAAGIGLFLVGFWLFCTPHDWASLYGRDLKVYQTAIDTFAAGGDPYQAGQGRHAYGFFFTAPPFVWMLYRMAAHSGLKAIFGSMLVAADVISVVALPAILGRLFFGPGLGRIALGAGVFFAAFAGGGFFTALVMNNGTPLYALIALGLIPAVTRDRWLGFHVAVALATAFKPYYAAFWLVPVLADGPSARRLAESALAFAVAAATYALPLLLAPKLVAEWTHTLLRQTVGENLLGDNLLGAMTHDPAAAHGPVGPYAAQLIFSAVLVGGCLMLGRLNRTQRIAALVLAAVFLNPRAMRYDLCMAAIPLVAVAAGMFSRDRPGATAQAVWAVILAGAMIVFSHSTPADGFLYAGIAVAALLGAAATSRAMNSPSGRN